MLNLLMLRPFVAVGAIVASAAGLPTLAQDDRAAICNAATAGTAGTAGYEAAVKSGNPTVARRYAATVVLSQPKAG